MNLETIGEVGRRSKNFLLTPLLFGFLIGHIETLPEALNIEETLGNIFRPVISSNEMTTGNVLRSGGGYSLMASGVLLNFLSKNELRKSWDNNMVATGGIYRVSRNPLYDGDRLFAVGATMLAPSGFLFLVTMGILFGTELAARGEERELKREYGDSYMRYRAQVPRFLKGNLTRF